MSVKAEGMRKVKRSGGKRVLTFRSALKRYWVLYIILFVIMAYYCLFYYYTILLGIEMAFKNVKLGFSIADPRHLPRRWLQLLPDHSELHRRSVSVLCRQP